MPLLRYDVSVNSDGKEKVIHKTNNLSAAVYKDDVAVYPIAWHWHEEFELLHLLEGSIQFLIGTSQIELHGGEAIFINSQMLHRAWNVKEQSCPYHSIVFHPLLIGGNETSVFWRKYIQPIIIHTALPYMILREDNGWQSSVIDWIEEAWREMKSREEGYEFEVRRCLSNCVFKVYQNSDGYMSPPSEIQIRKQERTKTMILFIEEHMAEEITISDIAASAYISSTECMRCFKEILHTTPIRFLKQIRLRRAEKLLSSTDLKVEEIGLKCGFHEMSYFARSFRKEYGANPLSYRKGGVPAYVHRNQEE